ncbi:LemA family protein [candidate division WOR-1 bacterium RIFOXYA12_FULL_52_29]|uniref:LemA family protein n=1 Tax=candidate division WOR-1 bacterium RIFOXYC12_FULL_54_18 TaxID=1802584 RepID=A0A1F4T7A9_UNCSA|nr:MAG: LemA family protein [candidate division WOR-1 bacterium RIFOXYA2_FULL_51_19]OGC18215.1 MAG: LemA family protein [candidate division WOR-1 bacterium RIFOXYA12_FULL_52_29]OGC27070.1 MAG: LemA family protein [candidate division WOR-1 bacterium RIFOXYB2_FULL_45_9]OGC28632.1 MAG: LemA family protein [candidate division WOR-1 bacterium RIFOXYC12_FULL_54_18]OGC30913.1 MAG: LemA family protein [candidate division WOR-1 bacterium RIFOXYB12_FULL_52_16]
MNKWLIGILVVIVFLGAWSVGVYNGLVGKDQEVKQSWAQVENQLQRRYDLIPNLVETVKGYATHEKELFENVAAARSAWAGAKSSSERINAANQVEGVLGRLLAVVESYPQLKASENFRALQDELAGTENRIAVARMRYNDMVQGYNVSAKSIPTVFVVRLFGFDPEKIFFAVPDAAKEAPKVKF